MEKQRSELTLVVRSPSFGANGAIPVQFSVEGDNTPPALVWERVPEEANSIAIICEDPDAPGRVFTHWIVVGIPPLTTHFDPIGPPPGTQFGKNDHGSLGWYGPNPQSGRHRYAFRVFALDINLDKPNLTREQFDAAIEHHVVARGELVGTFEKKPLRSTTATLSTPSPHR
ncbi:MAG: YbhB/YbcL family Raf kinase inhibitor-like protein [Myxococcota bacterium]|nr:YbhB/YbcL family Raf kinase inhibitor-like protein [Myxococcota bacterium]